MDRKFVFFPEIACTVAPEVGRPERSCRDAAMAELTAAIRRAEAIAANFPEHSFR